MSPKSSASFRTVTSLLTDRRLRSWLSGAVLTTWSLTCSKLWRWAGTSGETPCSPPTHNHEKLCNYSGVIQIPGLHNFSGPEVGQSHWVHGEKGPAEDVLPLKKIRKQKNRKLRRVVRTAERIIGIPPPPLSKNCAYPEWAKDLVKSLWTLTSSTLTLWTVTVWSTLQSSEHQNDQTQKQFLPSGNPSHEHLTITWNTQHYYTSFIHHTYLFTFQICTYHTCTYITVCYILCFLFYFLHCLFCIFVYYYFFIIWVLCCCCVSVALWSFCHYNKFLVSVNIPTNKAHSHSYIYIYAFSRCIYIVFVFEEPGFTWSSKPGYMSFKSEISNILKQLSNNSNILKSWKLIQRFNSTAIFTKKYNIF